jgi:hypothetical protein
LKEEALDRIKWRNRFGRGFGRVVWQITDEWMNEYVIATRNFAKAPNNSSYLSRGFLMVWVIQVQWLL